MYIFILYVKCGEKFRGIKTTLNLPLIFSIEEEWETTEVIIGVQIDILDLKIYNREHKQQAAFSSL